MSDNTPTDLAAPGLALWESVAGTFDLDEHERRLLHEASRTVDVLDELAGIVSREGAIIEGPSGPRAHPAAVEARQQRIALARLVAVLRLPSGEDGDRQAGARTPQRRVGARGVYGIRGAVS